VVDLRRLLLSPLADLVAVVKDYRKSHFLTWLAASETLLYMHCTHFFTIICLLCMAAKPMAMAITSVGELVKAARNGRSQKEFAEFLGVKQSSVSRYESGKASPPIRVIEKCMQMVHAADADDVPTADQLAERIRASLADPSLWQARLALSRLLDAFVSERVQTRLECPVHQ
jgi:transcriptional regulator with XRE-family HTH domain